MASSGSFLTKGWYSESNDEWVYLEFVWNVIGSSIVTNSTTISWELRCKRKTTKYVMAGGFKVIIDGTTVYEKDKNYRIPLYKGTVVATGTHTIVHDDYGNRTFTASASAGIYAFDTNRSGSGTWELPKINRIAAILSAPDFTDEDNPTITYLNSAESLVERIDACISLDTSMDDVKYKTISSNGSSYTFVLTDKDREMLRNATTKSKTRKVYFILRSTIGGEYYYSAEARILTIANAEPGFTEENVSYADVNEAVVAVTENPQHIVQNFSSLTAYITDAEAKKGATMSHYTIELHGITKTTAESGAVDLGGIDSSQDLIMTVTAVDSRGNTTTVEKTVTMFEWVAPTFTATVERINNYETDTIIKPKTRISSVNGKNKVTATYRSKKVGEEYGEPIEITANKDNIEPLDNNYDFWVLVHIVDSFAGEASAEYFVPKGKFPLFIDTEKAAVSINEFPREGEALRVAGGVASFDDGIVLKSETKLFKITINDNGELVIAEMK